MEKREEEEARETHQVCHFCHINHHVHVAATLDQSESTLLPCRRYDMNPTSHR